eukprot:gene1426-2775_t
MTTHLRNNTFQVIAAFTPSLGPLPGAESTTGPGGDPVNAAIGNRGHTHPVVNGASWPSSPSLPPYGSHRRNTLLKILFRVVTGFSKFVQLDVFPPLETFS